VSDATPATLVAGSVANVPLVLHRNGTASVGVDFQDDDAGTTPTCGTGQVMCGGTCANTASDPANCGACGAVCANGPNANPSACVSGACVRGACNQGFSDCNNNLSDGCETNTSTSVNNCGACGVVCFGANAVPACTNGVCTIAACNAGFINCDGNVANGCEVNPLNNAANCGACGHACASGHACVNAVCQ
jgi:hypothetical protein